ncbi:hypothetical protein ACOME3_005057 [Neoechinorhynchus agilis]
MLSKATIFYCLLLFVGVRSLPYTIHRINDFLIEYHPSHVRIGNGLIQINEPLLFRIRLPDELYRLGINEDILKEYTALLLLDRLIKLGFIMRTEISGAAYVFPVTATKPQFNEAQSMLQTVLELEGIPVSLELLNPSHVTVPVYHHEQIIPQSHHRFGMPNDHTSPGHIETNLKFPILEFLSSQLKKPGMDGLHPESHHLIGMPTEALTFQPEVFSPVGQTNNDVQFPIFEKLISSHLHNTQIANELPTSYNNGLRSKSHHKCGRPTTFSDYKPEKFSPDDQLNTNLQFPIFEKLVSSLLEKIDIANHPPEKEEDGFRTQSHQKCERPTTSSDFKPEKFSLNNQLNTNLQFPIFEKLMSSPLEKNDIANHPPEKEDGYRTQSHHKCGRPTESLDIKEEKFPPNDKMSTNFQFRTFKNFLPSQAFKNEQANEHPQSDQNEVYMQFRDEFEEPNESLNLKPEIQLQTALDFQLPTTTTDIPFLLFEPYNQGVHHDYGLSANPGDVKSEVVFREKILLY